jgi:subtilisin family serine protease
VLLAASASSQASGTAPGERTRRDDRVVVRLAPGRSMPESFARAPGARHLFGNWWRLAVLSDTAGASQLARFTASGDIDLVEADLVQQLELMDRPGADPGREMPETPTSLVADDPLLVQQWHHRQIGAEAAWLRSTGDGVVVAVIDSGVKLGGSDGFCGPLAGEYDAVLDLTGPGVAVDRIGHGTFVAGVVAQCTGNSIGGAGVAPGASILAIRACTDDAFCASSDVAAAIDWATTHGARVINLSLGMACGSTDWPECSTAVENDAIARAAAAGVVVVANAGNRHEDHLGFPANHPQVLGIGGVEARRVKTSYSSWGTALSVMAPAGEPGVDTDDDGFDDQILQETLRRICVFGAVSGFTFCRWSGTSFAAPHVAGTAALLLEAHRGASRDQVRRAIEESAVDRGAPGFDPLYGHGALQADAALVRLDEIVAEEGEGCVSASGRLCLLANRFAAEVTWTNYQGVSGVGTALPLTSDSGLFWFFAPANVELLVKLVDGCSYNGHYWVYAAATTDVEYHLRVTESSSGAFRTFDNILGTASPAFTSIDAFPCAPD